MIKLEEMYASTLEEAIDIAMKRKSFYYEQRVKTLFNIVETGLSIMFKVEIWGNLK